MKTKKKIFLLILIFLFILAPKNIIALTSGAYMYDRIYVGVPEHDEEFGYPAFFCCTLDGEEVYCIEMGVSLHKAEYAEYDYDDPSIGYALVADHGYTDNDAANYQIRQAVIWALLGQIDIEGIYAGDSGCVRAAKKLYYDAKEYKGTVEKPKVSTSSIEFEIDGSEYVSNAISVSKSEGNEYYDINLGGFPDGTYITDMDGDKMQTDDITWNSEFQIRIPLEVIKYDITNINMKVTSTGIVYNTTKAYHAPKDEASQEVLSSKAESSKKTSSVSFKLVKPIKAQGSLEVKKLDEYGKTIAGTVFKITNGTETFTQSTGSDGIARFIDLPVGKYTITETSATDGYFNDKVDITANVIAGLTVNVEKTNKESNGNVKIIKRDAETGETPQGDAKLSGAVYKVYANEDIYAANKINKLFSKGDEVGTCTTGEDGTTNSIQLPLGKYKYREVSASEGYILNDEEIEFTIEYDNQYVELVDKTFTSKENVKRNSIEIIKKLQATDSTPQQNLAGAKFSATLKSDRSKVYYSTVTDNNGYCIIENLPYGTYEIEEVEVPVNALKIENFDVFIEEDSSEREPYRYTKEDVAKKMQITIYKEDRETGTETQGDARLEEAEYTIYRDEALTDAIETVKISKQDDGTYSAKTGYYLIGKYYIKETKRPEGYLADEEIHIIEQLGENQTEEISYHEITSTEPVERGNIYIVKYQENNTNEGEGSTTKPPATGVELTLTLNSDPSVSYKSVVNDIGYAEFIDIPYGWYTITETKSLEFVDIMDPQAVYVSYEGQTLHYIVEDPRYERKLKIVKKDSETENTIPLAGATFKVWDVATKQYISQVVNYPTQTQIDEFITSNDGTLTLPEGLIPGEYELEEVSAPYGYVLNTSRVPFTIDATTPEEPEYIELTTVEFPDTPQKARIIVYKKGEVVTSSKKEDDMVRPVYEEMGLQGVEYTIKATENITTPDGSIRMYEGDTITFVTDKDGIGKSPELYLGSYTIRESKTVNGYLIQSEEIPFVLDYKGQELAIYDKNLDYVDVRQKMKLKIKKNMEDSSFLDLLQDAYKDVVLGIYTREDMINYNGEKIIDADTLVDKLYITAEGVNTSNYDLPLGKYYIKEIATNENYILNDNEYDFEFASNDDITSVITINLSDTIQNDLTDLGKFKLYKYTKEERNLLQRIGDLFTGYDSDVKTHALSNVKFKLYYDDNGVAKELYTESGPAEYVTDENGIIEVNDLPFGKYYYQEIEAPYGYEIDNKLYEFNITDQNVEKPFYVEVNNKLKEIKVFTKIDAFNAQKIPGCTFEIRDESDKLIFTGTTNNDGDFYMPIDLLEIGKKYYYIEISAPDIYQINTDKHEFSMNEDMTFTITNVENLRKTSKVKLNKTDLLGGNKIPNCTFELRSEETDFVVTATTDENGECYFENIPYGTYIYTEISAPDGYIIDTTPHRFTVDSEEEEINVINESIVNTSDINLILFTMVLIASVIGISYVVYKNREMILEKIRKDK